MAEAVTSHIRAGPWQKVGFILKVRPTTPLGFRGHAPGYTMGTGELHDEVQ